MSSDFERITFHPMTVNTQGGQARYIINCPRYRDITKYKGPLKLETVKKMFEFAYSMTFSGEGEHRDYRSGGSHRRRAGEIFANAFQGKIAEFGVCNLLYSLGFEAEPDMTVSKLGHWDAGDISINGCTLAVKSTKNYGNLLLLEAEDWDADGNYIPGSEDERASAAACSAVLLVRVHPNCEDILKAESLLYTDTAEREVLWRLLASQEWKYDCTGFITQEDLRQIISEGFLIPKGALLSGGTCMDADNYYVQAGDLRPANQIRQLL